MALRNEAEYEDLLAQWADLESGLGTILASPASTQQFASRVVQYDRWMQDLMQRDPDLGLYLLFQLAGNSPVGYSAAHALICAVLCHLSAPRLLRNAAARDSAVRAALTMNVAMTALQDKLSHQQSRPTPEQQEEIRLHPLKGSLMLESLGVQDADWLGVVAGHHDNQVDTGDFQTVPPLVRLTRLVKSVDRYAAMISPRLTRAGRSASESARALMAGATAKTDPVSHAIVRSVGLCPPGTYVHMDDGSLGVVVKRGTLANLPYVAIVGDAHGELQEPRLHDPALGAPRIESALSASHVRAQINHHQVLRLADFSV